MNPKIFYAEMLDKYEKIDLREWFQLKSGKPYDFNQKYYHLLSESEDENMYRTYCGETFSKKENPLIEDDNIISDEETILIEGFTENVEVKCYGCLKNMWDSLEKELLNIDPCFFEGSTHYKIQFYSENKRFINKLIEKKNVRELDKLINQLVRDYTTKNNINI